MSFHDVTVLRKSGKLEEAYALAKADMENNRDVWSCRALFWVLHDYTKKSLQESHLEKAKEMLVQMGELLPDMEETGDIASKSLTFGWQSYGWAIYRRLSGEEHLSLSDMKALLNEYFFLKLQQPSLLHSLILHWVSKNVVSPDFNFINFFVKWGIENFREEDWQSEEREGMKFEPIAVKVLERLFDELKAQHYTHSFDFLGLFEKAVAVVPDFFTKRRYAILLAHNNRKDEALSIYRQLIIEKGDWYIWMELAQLSDDTEIRLSLLCKAISMPNKDEFVGKVRLALADCLIKLNKEAEAATELTAYKQTYERNKWALSTEYMKMCSQVDMTRTLSDNRKLYLEYLDKAYGYAYEELPITYFLYLSSFTDKKNGKNKCRLLLSNGKEAVVPIGKFHLLKQAASGTFFQGHVNQAGEILTLAPSENEALKHFAHLVKRVNGIVQWNHTKSNPKKGDPTVPADFGFLQNCYVPRSIAKRYYIHDQTTAEAMAVKLDDKWLILDFISLL